VAFEHFKEAQARAHATAMEELRRGHKTSHWIWYVFPQLRGLGSSTMAMRYALPDPAAAKAYLADPELRARLIEATEIVHDQICERDVDVQTLMGSDIDALKLVSSLTLFSAIASRAGDDELKDFARIATEVLDKTGMPRCAFTERMLRTSPA
jgi:uncharacterized protein (DUF1810 family)